MSPKYHKHIRVLGRFPFYSYSYSDSFDDKIALKRLILTPYTLAIIAIPLFQVLFQVYNPQTQEEFVYFFLLCTLILSSITFTSFFLSIRRLVVNAFVFSLLLLLFNILLFL